jgi:predicted type IV restriction endonuclease
MVIELGYRWPELTSVSRVFTPKPEDTEVMNRALLPLLATAMSVFLLSACQTATKEPTAMVPAEPEVSVSPFDRPGFEVQVDDGRLWVLKPGQEKSGKHVTLIGAGPQGMTLRALDQDTALEYLAAKPGFKVEVTDGRLWVLKPDQEKSGKHVSVIGAGPKGMTLRALDMDTALEYLAVKPGFDVEVADGRLWVLKPGQEKGGKHVTLIGAGPQGMTLRALDMDTALEYLAAKPGFDVEAADGRLWVLKPGQEKSGKHVTRIGAGPQNATVRALDAETLESYLAYRP